MEEPVAGPVNKGHRIPKKCIVSKAETIMAKQPNNMSSLSHRHCSVRGCPSLQGKRPKVHYHKFPQKIRSVKVPIMNSSGVKVLIDIRKAWEWLLCLGTRYGRPVTNATRICSMHFREEDYIGDHVNMQRGGLLKPTAVPLLYLPDRKLGRKQMNAMLGIRRDSEGGKTEQEPLQSEKDMPKTTCRDNDYIEKPISYNDLVTADKVVALDLPEIDKESEAPQMTLSKTPEAKEIDVVKFSKKIESSADFPGPMSDLTNTEKLIESALCKIKATCSNTLLKSPSNSDSKDEADGTALLNEILHIPPKILDISKDDIQQSMKHTVSKGALDYMVYCCVSGCESTKVENPDLYFHTFPKKNSGVSVKTVNHLGQMGKMDQRKAWEKVLLLGKFATYDMTVCSKHFRDEDYIADGQSRWPKLNQSAVPSQNLPKGNVTKQSQQISDEETILKGQTKQGLGKILVCKTFEDETVLYEGLVDGEEMVEKPGNMTEDNFTNMTEENSMNMTVYEQLSSDLHEDIVVKTEEQSSSDMECEIVPESDNKMENEASFSNNSVNEEVLVVSNSISTDKPKNKRVVTRLQKEVDDLKKTNRRLQKEREGSLKNLSERRDFRSYPEKLALQARSNSGSSEKDFRKEEELQQVKSQRDRLQQQLKRMEDDYQSLKDKRILDLTALQDAHERETSNYVASVTPLREQLVLHQPSERKRAANFSNKEESILIFLAKKYRHIIDCRLFDGETSQKKNRCWDAIEEEFNARSDDTYRTKDCLRTKYTNLKKRMKKNAKEKCYSLRTYSDLIKNEITDDEVEASKPQESQFDDLGSEIDGEDNYGRMGVAPSLDGQKDLETTDFSDADRNVELVVKLPKISSTVTPTMKEESKYNPSKIDKCTQSEPVRSVIEEAKLKFLEEEHKLKLELMREKYDREFQLMEKKVALEMKLRKDEHQARRKMQEEEHTAKVEMLLSQKNK
ncbi:unnamed protein product [Acanthoscelides obtectus]|nr:unnamed protein product [Acanthoscelides obtectus]CAK1667202.1 Myb/SANT-like DNA-binding domain-containing protein 3 [Acanthoscelides obtectus]